MWLLRSAHRHIGQDTLSEYLDGRLLGRALERAERQLEGCDACRQELAELQATVALMRRLPMETPPRSFLMSAPPPDLVRARPTLVLRAPNWVYAGAASVAALALAVTVAVDATGGLSSEPPRGDTAVTALAAAPASEKITAASGAGAEPALDQEAAPLSLAAGADTAQRPSRPAQDGPAAGGAAAFAAETAPPATSAPPVAPGPVTAAAPAAQDGEATMATSPDTEPTTPDVIDDGPSGGTSNGAVSIWWRVLEATAGVLAVVFLTVLFLRRRAGRRDAA